MKKSPQRKESTDETNQRIGAVMKSFSPLNAVEEKYAPFKGQQLITEAKKRQMKFKEVFDQSQKFQKKKIRLRNDNVSAAKTEPKNKNSKIQAMMQVVSQLVESSNIEPT